MAATNENERKITHTLTDREGQREKSWKRTDSLWIEIFGDLY